MGISYISLYISNQLQWMLGEHSIVIIVSILSNPHYSGKFSYLVALTLRDLRCVLVSTPAGMTWVTFRRRSWMSRSVL
jgi:hypothetical protein